MTDITLQPSSLLIDAIRVIESSSRRTAVVLDYGGRLLGTMTDGDVRRHLLSGGSIDTCVSLVMGKSPLYGTEGLTRHERIELMRQRNVAALPIVDDSLRFLYLCHVNDLRESEKFKCEHTSGFCAAIIMAGGEGRRLRPLTNNIPKPMIPIGGIPLLERQVKRLALTGIKKIFLSVNYLGHIIEEHFRDGSDFGVEIAYLREKEKLGTGGSLSLLPEHLEGTVLVMNGDILTSIGMSSFYDFHFKHGAALTIAAIEHRVDIPYGVIECEEEKVICLREKPSKRFLCNAGIYSISTGVLKTIQPKCRIDMTELITKLIADSQPVAVFPVYEYWSDIGTIDDLDRARADFLRRDTQ